MKSFLRNAFKSKKSSKEKESKTSSLETSINRPSISYTPSYSTLEETSEGGNELLSPSSSYLSKNDVIQEAKSIATVLADKRGYKDLFGLYRSFKINRGEVVESLSKVAKKWENFGPLFESFITEFKTQLNDSKIESKDERDNDMRNAWSLFLAELNTTFINFTTLLQTFANKDATIPNKAFSLDDLLVKLPNLIDAFDQLELDILLGLTKKESHKNLSLYTRIQDFLSNTLFSKLKPLLMQLSVLVTEIDGNTKALAAFRLLPDYQKQLLLVSLQGGILLLKHIHLFLDKIEIRFPTKEGFLTKQAFLPNKLSLDTLGKKLSDIFTSLMAEVHAAVDHDLIYPYSYELLQQRKKMHDNLESQLKEYETDTIRIFLDEETKDCIKFIDDQINKLEAEKKDSALPSSKRNAKLKKLRNLSLSISQQNSKELELFKIVKGRLELINKTIEELKNEKLYSGRIIHVLDKAKNAFKHTKKAVTLYLAKQRHLSRIKELISVSKIDTASSNDNSNKSLLSFSLSHDIKLAEANNQGGLAIGFQELLRLYTKDENFSFDTLKILLEPNLENSFANSFAQIKLDPLHSMFFNEVNNENKNDSLNDNNYLVTIQTVYNILENDSSIDNNYSRAVQKTLVESKILLPEIQELKKDMLAPPTKWQYISLIIKNISSVFSIIKNGSKAVNAAYYLSFNQFLKELQLANLTLKNIFLILDKLEIQYNLEEGYLSKKINFKGYTLDSIARKLNEKVNKYNNQFTIEDRYPYDFAKLHLRKSLIFPKDRLLTNAILMRRLSESEIKVNELLSQKLSSTRLDIIKLIEAQITLLKNQRSVKLFFRAKSRKFKLENNIQWLIKLKENMSLSGNTIFDAVTNIKYTDRKLYQKNIKTHPSLLNFHRQIQAMENNNDYLNEKKIIDKIHKKNRKTLIINPSILETINSRITQLEKELNKAICITSDTKKKKISLLQDLKNELVTSSSFQEAIDNLRRKTPDNEQNYYLLFEGRTGEVLNDVEMSTLTKKDITALIDAEIFRLEHNKYYFFKNMHYKSDFLRISALKELKEYILIGKTMTSFSMSILERYEADIVLKIHEWQELKKNIVPAPAPNDQANEVKITILPSPKI